MPLQPGFIPASDLLATGRRDDLAVCADGARRVQWSEFARHAGGIARAVLLQGGKRWLIHCEHPLHFAAGLLAVLGVGRTAVLPPGLQSGTAQRLSGAYDAILADSGAPALDVRSVAPAPFGFGTIDPRAARVDLYTSGSSGEPKRVDKTLHQLQTEARALEDFWGERLDTAVVVATVPHYHIYGLLFRLLWPLGAGRCFDAALCTEPDLLMQTLKHHGDAVLVSSPAHLARLPELVPLEALRGWTRRIFSSGGPLAAAVGAEYQRRLGAPPTEIYGSTESGGIAWREQDGSEDAAAWRAFPGMQLRTDPEGALCLRSAYLGDDAWLTMGDAAELLPDGRFRLKGRLDRVVKVEGKRISLPELEHALRQHPWVRDASLVPLDGSRDLLGAVVILRDAAPGVRERCVAGLRAFLLERFERVLVPRQWRFVSSLPTDERGKLTAAALRTLFRKPHDAPAS